MLELRTLGTLAASATSPDGVRQLARGKPVALLAFLSAAPGRRASRERLATLLWSDGSSEQARQNLRQTIWYIRRRLGPVLEAPDDFLGIAGDCTVDRDAFVLAVREQRLADAVALYRGEFIPDFAAPGAAEFEQWCDVERRRLRALYLGCADTLARQALGKGQAATAVELARQARDAAPYDLGPWRLLLEALVAARDPVAALAEAESCEAMLTTQELEADPATRAAIRSARNAAQTSRTAAGASTSTHTTDEYATFAPELIGREAEFSGLLDRWEQAKAGRGGAVLVTGVAGLGKSRLLSDLHARLRASRARAVLVRANPGDRAVAGGFAAALAETVAQRPGSAGISAESAGVLVALAPALASVYTQAAPDRSSGEDAQRRRVSAMLELLRAVSDENALALLLDDLHWVDADSRRLLDAVAARLEGGRVLLVLAARPPIESLGGFGGLPRIELARLDLARVAEFVTRLGELPHEPWAAELPAQLLAATRGIPLTIIEALQRLIEDGSLALRESRWSSTASQRLFDVLRDGAVLESRVRSLSAGPRELLLILATLGRPMRADGVAADSRLTELEQRGFVTRVDGELHVSHDEVAAAALAVATDAERETAHARAAALLSAEPASDATLMLAARHAVQGRATELMSRLGPRWMRNMRAAGRRDSAAALLAELLGHDAPAQMRALALSNVPWWQRPSRGVLQGLVAAHLVIAALVGWSAVTGAREPDLEYIVQLDSGTARYARVTIPDINAWDRDQPIEAELLDPSEVPGYLEGTQRARVSAMPDGSGWVGSAFFPDSGGDEVLFVDRDGALRRPVSSSADDGGWAASPDGRYILFASARWHPETDRYQVAVYDRRTGTIRRLTHSDDFDSVPSWSPDGTRIAFMRNSFTRVAPVALCVVHVDGQQPRCDWPGLTESVNVRGWVDDVRVLLEEAYTGRNFIYDLESAETVNLPTGNLWDAPDARVFLMSARDGSRNLFVGRSDLRGGERQVLLGGRPISAEPRVLQGAMLRRMRYVDSLAVDVPTSGLPVDLSHRVLVHAFDSVGREMPARALRIRVLDTTVARVDGEILRPRRVGDVALEVTLGGWITDTVVVRIVPSTARDVVNETWATGFGQRWRPFGTPPGVIGAGPGFATLRPNGDGSYSSGAYLVDSLPIEDGIGFETRVSIPVNRMQWQNIALNLLVDVSWGSLAGWDHRTGNPPVLEKHACSINFGGEGGAGFTHYEMIGLPNQRRRSEAPPSLFAGRWHTVRLQYFPDGRCGAALDGQPVMMTAGRMRATGSAMLRVTGHSYGTTVQMGPIRVWTGVLGGVDWAKMDGR